MRKQTQLEGHSDILQNNWYRFFKVVKPQMSKTEQLFASKAT